MRGRCPSIALATAMLVGAATGAAAHRLDEYLQAARIDVQADGVTVHMRLTPGVATAESIVRSIDRNRDSAISTDEQLAYVLQVVSSLDIEVDGQRCTPHLQSWTFPGLPELRHGEGAIRVEARATHPTVSPGLHTLFFRNRYDVPGTVYLANALVPSDGTISITGQGRDRVQRELTIEYSRSVLIR